MPESPSVTSSILAASSSRDFTFDTPDPQPGTAKPRMAPKRLLQHIKGSAFANSYIVDYATLILLLFILVWSETANPFYKVFYIKDDQEWWKYSYPLHEKNTVPSWTVPVIATMGPLSIILLSSLLFRPSAAEQHSVILGLFSAVIITATLTNLIKLGVGRPRPNFMARCWPDGVFKFFDTGEPNCASNAVNPNEGRKSFPSGHTSWSTSGLGYLTFYLAGRLRCFDGTGHPVRMVLAGLPLCFAGWVGITRLQDYWHHWEDVFAGFVLGLTIAYLCYRQHFPSLLGPKSGEAYANNQPESQGWEHAFNDVELGMNDHSLHHAHGERRGDPQLP